MKYEAQAQKLDQLTPAEQKMKKVESKGLNPDVIFKAATRLDPDNLVRVATTAASGFKMAK